jgi:acetyl esterase/lipase
MSGEPAKNTEGERAHSQLIHSILPESAPVRRSRSISHIHGLTDSRSPSVSPVFADLSGLPPLLLLVGEDELLLDDTLRVRDAAASVGTDVRVLIGKGMQHDWPLTLPWLDESKHAWNTIRRFLEAH